MRCAHMTCHQCDDVETIRLREEIADLLAEVARLNTERTAADEEATMLANCNLATTEQVIRSLRAKVTDLLVEVDATQSMLTQACQERDKALAEIGWLKRSIAHALKHPTLAGTLIENHHNNCASHAGHACTCTYAPTIPSLGVKP